MRPLLALGALLVCIFVVPGCWYLWKSGAFNSAKTVVMKNAEVSVRDARALIMEFRTNGDPAERAKHFSPEDLPKSLQIPHLRYAYVFRDRINLVMGRNPDWSIGARIWSADATTKHEDKPTAYPEVFFFQYCNDIPVSPTNQP